MIRARLRALLAEGQHGSGWVPDTDEPDELPGDDGDWSADEDDRTTQPVEPAHLPAGLGRHRAPGRAARLDPGRPGAWALWTVAVVAAVVVVGWTWVGRPVVDQVPAAAASGAPAASVAAPPPTPTDPSPVGEDPEGAATGTVVVSVVGLVGAPGLVTLPAGARVADALAAAGGLLPEADPASVNAAAVVSDGQQIAVGVPGAVLGTGGPDGPGAVGAVLDLNTATVAELDALPGIGPVLAQRIVDHRSTHGPFTSVNRLDDVSGIGPAIFAELAERVRV